MKILSRAIATAIIASWGCSSSDTTTPSGTPDGADPGVDFTIFVVDANQGADTWTPVAGASAFLDTSSGTRIEATADASGRVVFHGVSFKDGPASVTAYKAGYSVFTSIGVTPDIVAKLPLPLAEFPAAEKSLPVALRPIPAPDVIERVKISGTIAGKLAETNTVTMTAWPGSGTFQAATPSYYLTVKKGEATKWVALEWTGGSSGPRSWDETKLRWLTFDVPAQSADGPLDPDLSTATPLTPTKVTLTLELPDASRLSQSPGWEVNAQARGVHTFLGSRSKVTPQANANVFTAEGEFVSAPAGAPPPNTFAYYPGFDGEAAFFQHMGLPVDGETMKSLAYPDQPQGTAVGGDVALDGIDPGAEVILLEVVDHTVSGLGAPTDKIVWQVQTLYGSPVPKTITLADLPDAARAVLPDAPQARVVALAGKYDSARPYIFARGSYSKFFKVSK